MTDKPIDIPALIRDLSTDENVPPLQEHVIAALEQAQAEIASEKARADAAEAALDVALHDAEQERKRGTEARKQAFQCAMERDAAREALLAGLAKADGLVATAAARGHDGWDNAGRSIVKEIRAALAATKETT